MARIARRLLENIDQRLESGELPELKDYKTLTGALREIKELGRAEEKKEAGLVVRFLGEAEDCSV